ncbi:hypothetical protein QKW35_05895 [Pontibacterium granulatum]|uniref:hypothetical protein n=1 Tax=Pontibacterium granulatum TaxID=2036029 RepID=UPI00249B95EE|nr:hypothetical protein [Pontibacterium granulatum]MDI3323900.1 hypothetical protein [Pontibacterium granulatum]
MRDITDVTHEGLPSKTSLFKATVGAALLGGALLITTVLPAEYGIDPTGLGKAMGLTALNSSANSIPFSPVISPAIAELNPQDSSPVRKRSETYQTKTFSLKLAPGQGTELKAIMEQGERFIFHWEVEGGVVNFDMHGEQPNAAKDEFTSYWVARNMPRSSGSFTAPFKGSHGWYWHNRTDNPVTVHLSMSGFFRDVYMP